MIIEITLAIVLAVLIPVFLDRKLALALGAIRIAIVVAVIAPAIYFALLAPEEYFVLWPFVIALIGYIYWEAKLDAAEKAREAEDSTGG